MASKSMSQKNNHEKYLYLCVDTLVSMRIINDIIIKNNCFVVGQRFRRFEKALKNPKQNSLIKGFNNCSC